LARSDWQEAVANDPNLFQKRGVRMLLQTSFSPKEMLNPYLDQLEKAALLDSVSCCENCGLSIEKYGTQPVARNPVRSQ
jgi:hypothetical protein